MLSCPWEQWNKQSAAMAVTQTLQREVTLWKGWEAGAQPVFPKQQGRAKSCTGSLAAGECGNLALAGPGAAWPALLLLHSPWAPGTAASCSLLRASLCCPHAGHSVPRGSWPCTHLGWSGSGQLPSLGSSKMPALMFSPGERNPRELAPFPALNFTHKCTHC